MDFDVSTNRVFCFGNSEEKKAVVPVECSMILPDYFPDVMKILRYTAKTVKSPVISENGYETVSGNVNIEVNYVSEEGELCSCSQLQSFGHSFECGGKIAAADAEISAGEIGCRAVNKRRIDIHGNIEIILRTVCGEEKNIVSSVSGGGAVYKSKKEEVTVPAGEFFKSFTIEEKGELGYGKPSFGKVIRSCASARATECHVIQDKVVTKGEVRVEVLWQGEPGEENEETGPFLSVFTFPVSRMVDAEGILQSDICDVGYQADFPEISPSDDGKNVNIKVKVGIFARVYRKNEIGYLTDMFSSEYEYKTEKTELSLIRDAVPVETTENIFEKFDLPESVESVMDIWAEVSTPEIIPEGKIGFAVKLCMFAKDADENPLYFEKNLEREILSPAGENKEAFHNLSAVLKNTEYSAGKDRKAEFSAEVLIDGTIYTAVSTEALSGCSVDAERKTEKAECAIVLCYAEKGEKLWDIAKRYKVPLENIMNENKIYEEELSEKTMLVISQ